MQLRREICEKRYKRQCDVREIPRERFSRLEVIPGGRGADQVLVHRRKHAIERVRRELGL